MLKLKIIMGLLVLIIFIGCSQKELPNKWYLEKHYQDNNAIQKDVDRTIEKKYY